MRLAIVFVIATFTISVRAQHPSLLVTLPEIEQLKQCPERWQKIKKEIDAELTKPIDLPPRGSNWWHWYICPKHSAHLKLGKQIGPWQWEHICPVDGEILHGDPTDPKKDFDGCELMFVHLDIANSARKAGLLYQLTGDRRYADYARHILLDYAAKYPEYPLHNTNGEPKVGGGKVGPQTLDEAVWLIPMCHAMDLVWDTLSDEDRKTIAAKLLEPATREVILPHKMPIHNIQCWKNSAVGLVGYLLDDQELVKAAIDDPDRGMRVQLSKGITADGPWWEGSWGYHFYTMSALWPLAEAARNHGIDFFDTRYKSLFDAPLKLAMPNLVLPNFNDSAEVPLATEADLYELAYERFHDDRYLPVIASGTRESILPVCFGRDVPKKKPLHEALSGNYPAVGYAILTEGAGADAAWACIKYGPHGGGHGHFDKNHLELYSRGEIVMPDAGTTNYGSPLHRDWCRTTLAHNALVVDESNQQESQGQSIAFGKTTSHGMTIQYSITDAGKIYPGVQHIRTVALLGDQAVVVIDQANCDSEHTLDLACHFRGKWIDSAGENWTLPDKPGYRHLESPRILSATGDSNWRVKTPAGNPIAITLAAGAPTETISATGVGSSTGDRVPIAIFRQHAKQATWIWAVGLDGKPVKLQRLPSGNGSVEVEATLNHQSLILTTNPAATPCFQVH